MMQSQHLLPLLLLGLVFIHETVAFTIPNNSALKLLQGNSLKNSFPSSTSALSQSNNDDNNNDSSSSSISQRFTSPKIDDIGLPLADALTAQIIAPSLQVFWLSANHAPIPSWMTLPTALSAAKETMLFATPKYGSLVAPTLIHGAGLATCWLLGALASKAYESDAFNISEGRGYGTVVLRIVQAGAFATGLLVASTQLDLFLEFGRWVQPGESDEIDLRLLTAIVELINDVVFEAGVLSAWRLYRASLTGDEAMSG